MSDRFHAFTVVLEKDTRDDDSEPIIAALRMIKGVASVTPHVADVALHSAEVRANHAVIQKLLALIETL